MRANPTARAAGRGVPNLKFAVLPMLALLAAPMSARAQPAATTPTTTAPAAAASAAPSDSQKMAQIMSKREDDHINRLHSQLQITPAEQPQWDQFAQVMRDNAQRMREVIIQRHDTLPTLNAADDMDSYAKLAADHASDMQKLATSFRTLYNAMPDAQKKIADQVFQARLETPRHHGKSHP